MFSVTLISRCMLLSLGAFLILVITGSVAVGLMCFPAVSHVPASLGCDLGLFSPFGAAMISGHIFGRKVVVAVSPFAAVVPIVGLGILLFTGHLHYWYGQDIAAALQLAVIYCLVPSMVASAVTATIFSRRSANAL